MTLLINFHVFKQFFYLTVQHTLFIVNFILINEKESSIICIQKKYINGYVRVNFKPVNFWLLNNRPLKLRSPLSLSLSYDRTQSKLFLVSLLYTILYNQNKINNINLIYIYIIHVDDTKIV